MMLGGVAGLAWCLGQGAEPESLPPIFAPKIEIAAEPAQRPMAPSAVSDRTHQWLTQVFQAKVANREVPGTSDFINRKPAPNGSDVVMMDRFVVRSSLFKAIELPKAVSPAVDFLQRGVLFRSLGKLQAEGMVNFQQVNSNHAGSGGTAPKIELRLNVRW